jgi:Methyl-accepting chemotaxis protein
MELSSWFRGLKGKLLLTAALPLVGFATLGGISISATSSLNKLLSSAHTELIPNMDALAEMRVSRNKFAYKAFASVSQAEHGFDNSGEIKSATDGANEFKAAYKDYLDTQFMPEEEKLFNAAKGDFEAYIAILDKIVPMLSDKSPENLTQLRKILNTDYDVISEKVRGFNNQATKAYKIRTEQESKIAADTQVQARQWIIMVTLLATFTIFGILLWIAARVSNSISSIAVRLSGASSQVATSVEQLNEAGNNLSHSSTEAAASLEETVASLEELSSMVQMNSDNAKQAATLSASSRDAAEKGQKEIETLIHAMGSISQSSKKIEEIISVIDDIAFQTNLLALNASVEAARAGEQGKGFAVVAEAVRTLAQRSAEAAKDITSLIKESVEQVEDGSKIADQSGAVLNNIVTSVKKVSDLNNEIASASSEQTSGIQQISKAMNQLDQASQSNAASAEEISATSGEVSNLAVTTQDLTVELSRVINGDTKGDVHTDPAPTMRAKAPTKKVAAMRPPQKSNVVSMPKKTASAAKEAIPFDEDLGKVGTTDGF